MYISENLQSRIETYKTIAKANTSPRHVFEGTLFR
ncbi:MAG: hypothetical protein JWN34_5128 [Bryobacterales bacterium]|nr:hypothetical protein [Bryobacterales bacterium]